MNKKKKAFTLSEALVTLAILGVLAAILIPVLDNVRPDKDKIMYKKAMYAMQGAVSSALDEISSVATNTSAYWADTNINSSENFDNLSFCKKVATSLNLVGNDRCKTNTWEGAEEKSKHYPTNKPDFMTTDGVMWWGLAQYKFGPPTGSDDDKNPNVQNSPIHDIYVTRKDQYENGDMKAEYRPLRIQVRYDGKVGVGTPTAGYTYSAENDYLEDALNVRQNKKMNQYE